MKCIYCGTPLSSIEYCTGCGADVTIQKRVSRISNLLYNEGLEKAQIRDLSGAISCLKKSLKFNKENIDARNLLGLCYIESGQVVAALGEWVLSKNIAEENNPADFYISKLQSNKNKLETINTTIKKYNQALTYCKQDNEDMAIIQLKKVLSQNPNLIDAYHLLSLIYMKQQDYEKARKLLKKAAQIDTSNTRTLRYLNEVEEATGVGTNLNKSNHKYRKMVDGEEKEKKVLGPVTYKHGNDMVIQPPTFRDSSSTATFINIALGFVLGAALVWFLAIPANTRKINHSASQQVTDANTKLASESAKVKELEAEVEDYQAKIEKADKTMEKADKKAKGYEVLLKAVNEFIAGDQTKAGVTLADVDRSTLKDEAQKLFDIVESNVKSAMYTSLYAEGSMAYENGNYAEAIDKLSKATEADDTQYLAWYYLAFAYYYSGDTKNADDTLAKIIVKFPAYEAELAPYITDQTVLSKAKTDGVITTNGDTTTTSTSSLANLMDNGNNNLVTDPNQGMMDFNTYGYDQNYNYGYDQTYNYGYDQNYQNYNYGYDQNYQNYNYGYDQNYNYGNEQTYNGGSADGYIDAYGNWISY